MQQQTTDTTNSSNKTVSRSQKNVKSFRIQVGNVSKGTGSNRMAGDSHSSSNRVQAMKSSGESVRSKVQSDGKKSERWVSILNSSGEDVTPQSLAASCRQRATANATESSSSVDLGSVTAIAKETVSDLLNHLEILGGNSIGEGGGAYKSIAFTSSASQDHESINDNDRGSDHGSTSYLDDNTADSSLQQLSLKYESKVAPTGISNTLKVKEADPMKYVTIDLKETETMFMLTIPSTSVSTEFAEESTFIRAQNAKYKELKSIIVNNDNYISKGTQALQNPVKSKEVQATGNRTANAEVNVSQWAIYDAFAEPEKNENADTDVKKEVIDIEAKLGLASGEESSFNIDNSSSEDQTAPLSREQSITGTESTSVSGSRTSISSSTQQNVKKDLSTNATQKEDLLALIRGESLMEKLALMERAIIGNNYSKKVLSYRNVPDGAVLERKRVAQVMQLNLENEENDDAQLDFDEKEYRKDDDINTLIPHLRFLWYYKCELTRGRTVTDTSLNKQNEDILAVSYTESKSNIQASPGLILVWSAKNPEWPDRIYPTKCQVTCIDFSKSNPSLLAAGFIDGRVVVYDIRKNDGVRVLNASENNGKHRDAVWELKWVERERVVGDDQSRGETLISVSTDGRVTQWIIRKGLEFTDLMVLKRVSKQKQLSNKNSTTTSNSFIARQTGGLCFDFNTKDSNMYLVGTEDGQIHKCSSSYNEQYLSTYSAHTGPVNKVKWSPFLPSVFLSCSADWTVRLWNQEQEEEILKLQSGKTSVNDIAWSPHSSTFFGTVSSNGKLEIWDLKFSVLDPVINHSALDRQLTAITFASQSPIVITGDDFGTISVYKICKSNGQTGYHSKRNEVEETDDGFLSEDLKLPSNDERYLRWRQEEAKILNEILTLKENQNVTVPSAN